VDWASREAKLRKSVYWMKACVLFFFYFFLDDQESRLASEGSRLFGELTRFSFLCFICLAVSRLRISWSTLAIYLSMLGSVRSR
jgi:hypothetical protein